MTDMKKTQVVYECDVCGEPGVTVTVAFSGESPWKVDLCPEHADPIRIFQSRSAPSSRPKRPSIRAPKTKKEGGPKTTHKVKLS